MGNRNNRNLTDEKPVLVESTNRTGNVSVPVPIMTHKTPDREACTGGLMIFRATTHSAVIPVVLPSTCRVHNPVG